MRAIVRRPLGCFGCNAQGGFSSRAEPARLFRVDSAGIRASGKLVAMSRVERRNPPCETARSLSPCGGRVPPLLLALLFFAISLLILCVLCVLLLAAIGLSPHTLGPEQRIPTSAMPRRHGLGVRYAHRQPMPRCLAWLGAFAGFDRRVFLPHSKIRVDGQP